MWVVCPWWNCISDHSFIHQCLYSPLLGPGHIFSFVILNTVGRAPWAGAQPIARLLPTHRIAQTQNKCTQTAMLWVGFEPTTAVPRWAKRVHALDCAPTVIDIQTLSVLNFSGTGSIHRLRDHEDWPDPPASTEDEAVSPFSDSYCDSSATNEHEIGRASCRERV
jgi:hypothetical protein